MTTVFAETIYSEVFIMKKLLTLVLCISLALALALPAFAGCNDGARTSNNTYVKSLYAVSYNGTITIKTALSYLGLTETYKNNVVGGDAGDDNDLNKGSGSDSQYVRLIYSEYTSNANEAITDLIAVYKDKDVEGNYQITVGGITYTALIGSSIYYTIFSGTERKNNKVFDFNDNFGDDGCHKAIYLYYTTDSRAGDPITKLNVYYDYANRTKENLVKEVSTNDVCNFNEGYDGSRMVFLQIERSSSSTGSVFADDTSVVFICAGVVVILAAIGFVVFKKRKGVSQ